jgi:prepilin-type N-terminal cleavage/methylation domain-containing protein
LDSPESWKWTGDGMRRGFTLIEVVVSAALISILILAISSSNLMSVKINRITRVRDGAFNLARGICEMYKVQDISDSYYNSGAVFKYINSSEEIEHLKALFDNSDGVYTGQELSTSSRSEGYIVILEPVRIYPPIVSSYPVPELITLRVTVRENGGHESFVSLTQIR